MKFNKSLICFQFSVNYNYLLNNSWETHINYYNNYNPNHSQIRIYTWHTHYYRQLADELDWMFSRIFTLRYNDLLRYAEDTYFNITPEAVDVIMKYGEGQNSFFFIKFY